MKFASSPLKKTVRPARSDVRAHQNARNEIHFVYDVCTVATPLADLRYILDAGRPPLGDLSEEAFRPAFGFDRDLRFKHDAQRARMPSDWWGAVYA